MTILARGLVGAQVPAGTRELAIMACGHPGHPGGQLGHCGQAGRAGL